ncbi:PLD nuclease N-terminal domain-containing protein [Myceligenerans pegani]|uniref:PLDc_N domain-containing protein n=1 Tax=Myceligenerans pegani TaxID=2776917 RepID=A0ABR9N643_9MICO|nr:PLD nuclease N-terminal domain-containing protein [Myceligenerans sp. TRM 65318]MBE1878619.1 PLDc_N domain-containing protein [Myceligenerans sp. TRM 65318]MBE3020890.1 PLDc_N domain-containing protein [Myceligenerans sp. TRM 65318]
MRPLLLGVLYVALVVYTLVDVAQSDDDVRHGIPKSVWVVAIVLLPLVGSIAWLVLAFIARRRRGRAAAAPWERASGNAPTPARPPADVPPAGPEDDPEYMWLLEQARRKREREERRRGDQPDESPDDEPRSDRPQNGNRPNDPSD